MNAFESWDRTAFLQALGLARFGYYFFEACDDCLLRACRVEEGSAEPLLDPWTLTPTQALQLASPRMPVYVSRREGKRLSVEPAERIPTLVEQTLPYPFDQLVLNSLREDIGALIVHPKGLLWSLRRFGAAFAELEKSLATSEIACLEVSGAGRTVSLILQHLAKRRVRYGRLAPGLKANPESLEAVFGTGVRLERLQVELQSDLVGQLEHLTQILGAALPESPAPPPSAGIDLVKITLPC